MHNHSIMRPDHVYDRSNLVLPGCNQQVESEAEQHIKSSVATVYYAVCALFNLLQTCETQKSTIYCVPRGVVLP